MFVVSQANRRLKTIFDMPKTTQDIVQYSWHSKLYAQYNRVHWVSQYVLQTTEYYIFSQ